MDDKTSRAVQGQRSINGEYGLLRSGGGIHDERVVGIRRKRVAVRELRLKLPVRERSRTYAVPGIGSRARTPGILRDRIPVVADQSLHHLVADLLDCSGRSTVGGSDIVSLPAGPLIRPGAGGLCGRIQELGICCRELPIGFCLTFCRFREGGVLLPGIGCGDRAVSQEVDRCLRVFEVSHHVISIPGEIKGRGAALDRKSCPYQVIVPVLGQGKVRIPEGGIVSLVFCILCSEICDQRLGGTLQAVALLIGGSIRTGGSACAGGRCGEDHRSHHRTDHKEEQGNHQRGTGIRFQLVFHLLLTPCGFLPAVVLGEETAFPFKSIQKVRLRLRAISRRNLPPQSFGLPEFTINGARFQKERRAQQGCCSLPLRCP